MDKYVEAGSSLVIEPNWKCRILILQVGAARNEEGWTCRQTTVGKEKRGLYA
jgi:hypothetical protein